MEGSHNYVSRICAVDKHAGRALESAGLFLCKCKGEHHKGYSDKDSRIYKEFGACCHRLDHTCHAEDKENVEDVGSYHVTHSDTRIALLCRDY